MSKHPEIEIEEAIERAVADERERCARLCELRADISRASARDMRSKGSFETRSLWPPFRRVTCVAAGYERAAKDLDLVAHAFDVVARGIRAGWDARTVEHPDKRIPPPFPCTKCIDPMDCGSWQTCANTGVSWPAQ